MPLIIDTFNVLHTVGVLPPEFAGIDVQGLIALLGAGRYCDQPITLVCDGMPRGIGDSLDDLGLSISIRFAGPTKLADDLISQIIGASTAPRRLIVVSSDHEIQRTARRRKCKAITSEEFLQQLTDDRRLTDRTRPPPALKPPPSSITPQQVDRWLDVFRLDEDTIAIPSGAPLEPLPESDQEDDATAEAASAAPIEAAAQPTPSVVPESLIQQAERLWDREVRPRDRSTAPPPRLPAEPPAPNAVAAPMSAVPPPRESEPPASELRLEDLADLDMNAILPDDGRTRRWKAD